MFKDVYKKANDDIKGDRAILDRAFLQAAQPVKKKSPVIKYSFVGTAVAAVLVLGAVFANPSVFTNRSNDLGKLNAVEPTQAVVNTTEKDDVAEITQIDAPAIDNALIDVPEPVKEVNAPKVKTVASQKETVPAVVEDAQNEVAIGKEVDDYGIAVTSVENESGEVYEYATGEAVGFTLRNPDLIEETTETIPEEALEETDEDDAWIEAETEAKAFSGGELSTEAEEGEAVEVFSYMYDVSCYKEAAITEGFVNTDISPVTNSEEAVERAKAECTVEYDTIAVYHDSIEDMWKVVFFMSDYLGGDQCVYMNCDGVTTLIVYGE